MRPVQLPSCFLDAWKVPLLYRQGAYNLKKWQLHFGPLPLGFSGFNHNSSYVEHQEQTSNTAEPDNN